MRIGAIVQARMSSSRFPKKTLFPICGRPLLQYLLERLQKVTSVSQNIVVATSSEKEDSEINEFCIKQNIECFRGSLLNVALRFKSVLEKKDFDAFIRVNGDSPLLDPHLVEEVASKFEKGGYTMVTNVMKRTFPKGQSVEILNTQTYLKSYPFFKDQEDFEHVTKYFYKNPNKFRIFNVQSQINHGQSQLSVDSPEDADQISKILKKMTKPHWEYRWKDILDIKQGLNGHE